MAVMLDGECAHTPTPACRIFVRSALLAMHHCCLGSAVFDIVREDEQAKLSGESERDHKIEAIHTRMSEIRDEDDVPYSGVGQLRPPFRSELACVHRAVQCKHDA